MRYFGAHFRYFRFEIVQNENKQSVIVLKIMLARYVYGCAREQGGKKSGKQDESSGMHCGLVNMWASVGPDNSWEHFSENLSNLFF